VNRGKGTRHGEIYSRIARKFERREEHAVPQRFVVPRDKFARWGQNHRMLPFREHEPVQRERILRRSPEKIPLILRAPQRNLGKPMQRFAGTPSSRSSVAVHDHRVAVAEDVHIVPAAYLDHEENALENIPLTAGGRGESLELLEKPGEIMHGRPEPRRRNGFPEKRSQDRFLLGLPRREEKEKFFPAFPAGNLLIYESVLAALGSKAYEGGTLHLHHPGTRG
jgi:hypothetical protein